MAIVVVLCVYGALLVVVCRDLRKAYREGMAEATAVVTPEGETEGTAEATAVVPT